MKRREFLTATGVAVLAASSTLRAAATASAKRKVGDRPNLIFILSDDIAQGDMGVYGQKLIQTPNLDRLCNEGTRYHSAYTGTSVCAPARTSFFTGLHMGNSPTRANRELKPKEGQRPLPPNTVTVGKILKSAGYATATMGKWGMGMFDSSGSPLKNGIDHFYGYNCQRHAHTYFPTYLYDDDKRFGIPENKTGKKVYAQELIQQDVLKWVGNHADEPFFLFYAITLPHTKLEIDDLGIYKDKPWSKDQKTYAAMVTRIDSDVAALVKLLEDKGIADNTVIVFAGDNGSSFSPSSSIGKRFDQTMGGKLRGYKRSMYEGALRQAAFAWGPSFVKAGRVTDEPWAFWDLLPTFAEFGGAKIPADFTPDGYSLVKFLKGGPAPKREYFYWELHEGSGSKQAIRWGDYKAVRSGPGKAVELYNLKDDLGETTNLAKKKRKLVAKAIEMMNSARTADPDWPDPAKPRKTPADPKKKKSKKNKSKDKTTQE